MYTLTDSDLKDLAEYLTIPQPNEDPIFAAAFEVFLNTGIRSAELLDVSRWQIEEGGMVTLHPQKGNSTRLFTVDELTPIYFNYLEGNNSFFDRLSERRLNHMIHRYNYRGIIKQGLSVVGLYLFRYNYVKQLHASGKSYAQIQNIMGWAREDIAYIYAQAELTTTSI